MRQKHREIEITKKAMVESRSRETRSEGAFQTDGKWRYAGTGLPLGSISNEEGAQPSLTQHGGGAARNAEGAARIHARLVRCRKRWLDPSKAIYRERRQPASGRCSSTLWRRNRGRGDFGVALLDTTGRVTNALAHAGRRFGGRRRGGSLRREEPEQSQAKPNCPQCTPHF